MLEQPQPRLTRGWTISLRRQPAILYTGDHGESEHAGARSLGPAFGMIDELAPQAILALEFEQRGHHLLITIKDARAPRMIFRQRAQQLSHSCRDPSVAAAPVKWRVSRMEEKAVRLLQLVQISGHRSSRAIEIPGVMRGPIGLHLHCRNHVHVVNPVTRFARNAVGRGLLPPI